MAGKTLALILKTERAFAVVLQNLSNYQILDFIFSPSRWLKHTARLRAYRNLTIIENFGHNPQLSKLEDCY